MATSPPSITTLPTPPDPNDRATFNARAYPWSVAQQTLATEVGAVADNVYANAAEAGLQPGLAAAQVALATTQANTATTQATLATAAALSAGAVAWVSGTTYAVGDLRYSPIDFQSYRRKVAGAGTTDPNADATNWTKAVPSLQDYQEFMVSGIWTKPENANWVYVEAIGGGASGIVHAQGPGGGGGAFNAKLLKASDVGASVTVTVGAGGIGPTTAARNVGGDSVFTGHVTAKGAPSTGFGGGGEAAGSNIGGTNFGSAGGFSSGGGGYSTLTGASCVKGGAGGSGSFSTAGTSVDGGNGGGNAGGSGSVPGGGGGCNTTGTAGAGGAGRVRVWAW